MTAKILTTAAAVVVPTVIEPTVWHPLGYTVQAGSLCGGLVACACVRVWVGASDKAHRWTVDAPVTLLTLLFTAAAIATIQPNLITAAMIGTGLGAVGTGIITKAKGWADRWLGDQAGEEKPGG